MVSLQSDQIQLNGTGDQSVSETEPRAVSAHYDPDNEMVTVELIDGSNCIFPVSRVQGLAGADPEDLAFIKVDEMGLHLSWPRCDTDLFVPIIVAGAVPPTDEHG